MGDEGSRIPKSGVRVRLFDTDGSDRLELDAAHSRSPLVGSAPEEDVNNMEDDSMVAPRSENAEAASGCPNPAVAASSETTVEMVPDRSTDRSTGDADMINCKEDSVSGDEEKINLQPGQSGDHCEVSLDDTTLTQSTSDQENLRVAINKDMYATSGNSIAPEQLDSPTFEGDSLNLQDRDPNYATQRPDTLGAINLGPPNATTAFPNVHRNAGHRFRGSGQNDAPEEDAIFDMVQLGRRTRGAGMEQVDLIQHHLAPGSDDGSDSGDAAEPDSNQCESTEADQYKMNPEADQSDSTRPDPPFLPQQESFGRRIQNRARANGLLERAQRYAERSDEDNNIEDDIDVEDIRDGLERTEEDDDQDWDESVNDHDLVDRTEDDRQYSSGVSERCVGGPSVAAASGKLVLSGVWLKEAVQNEASAGSSSISHQILQLKQHPNSAFSQLKPDGGNVAEGSASAIDLSTRLGGDRKPVHNGTEKKLNVILASQDQSMAKSASVFKPIFTENRVNSVGESGHRRLVPRQNSEGNAGDYAAAILGQVNKQGKTLSENGIRSRVDREDLLIDSPQLLTSNPSFEMGSMESLHGYMPRLDRLLYGEPSAMRTSFSNGSSTLGLHQHHHQQQQAYASSGLHQQLSSNNFEAQVTPQKQVRPYHLMEDSLELSPIRPPSSQISQQQHALGNFVQSPGIASLHEAFRTVPTDHNHRLQYYGNKSSSEICGSEISDIQEVRSHLHSLLTLSDRTIPDKSHYDQTNDVDELLTNHRGQLLNNAPSNWNAIGNGPTSFSSLQDALPLSSRYLLTGGAGQVKLDAAGLAAENHALRDAMEQQRFKRKHCEKQIQQLQNKVLELQQNLAVAVSIDRRKDVTIEQLDKTLVKIAEGWHQKEAECHEALVFLQKENASLKQTLESQQQVTSRLEMQLNHSLQQLHLEQQRAAQLCLTKDQHISELTMECQHLQQNLDVERQRWMQRLEEEKNAAEERKLKMQRQLEELKAAHEEEMENWRQKEKENLLNLEQLKESHNKALAMEKMRSEHQEQMCRDLEMVLRATQTEMEQLQLESETMMREKESLKVEMGLMEARHLSSVHQLEAELHSAAEKQLLAKLDELNNKQMESERKLHEIHNRQIQELAEQHREELKQLQDEHQATVFELKNSSCRQHTVKDSRINELEKQVVALEEENRKIETHKVELSHQLQSMMQSHCEEALRLLRFTHQTSNQGSTYDGAINSAQESQLSLEKQLELFSLSKGSDQTHGLPAYTSFRSIPTMNVANEDVMNGDISFAPDMHPTVSSCNAVSDAGGCHQNHGHQGVLSESAVNQLSAQYSHFLESVRNYQPLLADLNASVASVANSVSAMVQTSSAPAPFTEGKTVRTEMSSSAVVQQRNLALSPSQMHPQFQQKQNLSDHPFVPRHQTVNGGNIYLHSPVHSDEGLSCSHRQVLEQGQIIRKHPLSSTKQGHSMNGEGVGLLSDGQASFFTQILQHDMSGESLELMELTAPGLSKEPADNVNRRLIEQEQRQQQLHHYIQKLLQRSPGVPTQDQCPVSDGQQNTRQLDHDARPYREKSVQNGGDELRLQLRQGNRLSPEQDHQLQDRLPQPQMNSAKTQNERSPVIAQPSHHSQLAQMEVSSRLPLANPGGVLSQQQLAEISQIVERHKLPGHNGPTHPSSFLPQMSDLLSYLKTIYDQDSEHRTKSEQQSSPVVRESPPDHHSRDEILPRNHPRHQVDKELLVGSGSEAAGGKQDPANHLKSNRNESVKTKNSTSASKPADKKERLPGKNNGKPAAWK